MSDLVSSLFLEQIPLGSHWWRSFLPNTAFLSLAVLLLTHLGAQCFHTDMRGAVSKMPRYKEEMSRQIHKEQGGAFLHSPILQVTKVLKLSPFPSLAQKKERNMAIVISFSSLPAASLCMRQMPSFPSRI